VSWEAPLDIITKKETPSVVGELDYWKAATHKWTTSTRIPGVTNEAEKIREFPTN